MPSPFFLHLHTLKEDFPFSELTLKSAYWPCTNNFLSTILQVIQPIHYTRSRCWILLLSSCGIHLFAHHLNDIATYGTSGWVAQLVSLVFIKMSHCVCAHKLVIPHFEESTCNQVNARQMSNKKVFDFTGSSELTMVKSNGCQRLSKIEGREWFSPWICKTNPSSTPCPISCAFTCYLRSIGVSVVNVQRVTFRFNFQGKATFCGFGIQHRSRDVAIGSNFHSGWLSETALTTKPMGQVFVIQKIPETQTLKKNNLWKQKYAKVWWHFLATT